MGPDYTRLYMRGKRFSIQQGAKDQKLIYIFIVPFGTLVAAF